MSVMWASAASAQTPRPRFVARLADGSRVEGAALADWHADGAKPRLDSHQLLDPAKPFRWLIDRQQRPLGPPAAFVEMVCGDRLPGVVMLHEDDPIGAYSIDGSRLVVRPTAEITPPAKPLRPDLRVRTQFVRRIVWRRRAADTYEPGRLFFRDGRIIAFRTVRFEETGVTLLTDAGFRRASFSEIAELHLRTGPAWDAHLDDLALLCPNGDERLLQVETNDGLRVTTSVARFRAHRLGQPQDFDRWLHAFHPTWSVEALWVPCRRIWLRRSFAAHETPLFRLPTTRSISKSSLTGSPHPRPKQVALLRSGKLEFGWGEAVHAYTELHYELHDLVRSFRAEVGLDHRAGGGGCAMARVHLNSSEQGALYQSPLLVGSTKAPPSVAVNMQGPTAGHQHLVLVADPAIGKRPAGGDPLDIRDHLDWLDPHLLLDAAALKIELARRREQVLPAWPGFLANRAPTKPEAAHKWQSLWRSQPAAGQFTPAVIAMAEPFRIARRLSPSERTRWLILGVHRPVNQPEPTWLDIRLNGESIRRHAAPLREESKLAIAPLAVRIDDLTPADRPLTIEVRQEPNAKETPVVWSAVTLAGEPPMLRTLCEDDGRFAVVPPPPPPDDEDKGEEDPAPDAKDADAKDADAKDAKTTGPDAGKAADEKDKPTPPPPVSFAWDETTAYAGDRALKISGQGVVELRFEKPLEIRTAPEHGEYRYLRLALRKPSKSRFGWEWIHADAEEKPLRCDAGAGDPVWPGAVRLGALSENWLVVNDDFAGRFGEVRVTGVRFTNVDEADVWIDHIYVARSTADFALAEARVRQAVDEEAAAKNQAAVAMQNAAWMLPIKINDQAAMGAAISATGEVVTCGRLLGKPGDKVQVLVKGEMRAAVVKGICRELDIGLVQIEEIKDLPVATINNTAELPPAGGYFVATPGSDPEAPAHLQPCHIRSQSIDSLHVLVETETMACLLDINGRLVGAPGRRSQLRGSRFGRLGTWAAVLPRLQKGEVWGEWPSGSEPATGIELGVAAAGCPIEKVAAGSAGEKAGLKVGDLVEAVDSRLVRTPRDVAEMLAKKNAGENAVIRYIRDGKPANANVQLAIRN